MLMLTQLVPSCSHQYCSAPKRSEIISLAYLRVIKYSIWNKALFKEKDLSDELDGPVYSDTILSTSVPSGLLAAKP